MLVAFGVCFGYYCFVIGDPTRSFVTSARDVAIGLTAVCDVSVLAKQQAPGASKLASARLLASGRPLLILEGGEAGLRWELFALKYKISST